MCKLQDLVQFPLTNFSLDKFVRGPVKKPLGQKNTESKPSVAYEYDLYSVIRHSGSLSNGHYTAIATGQNKSEWYELNDGRHGKIPLDKVVDKTAYCCFYAKMVANKKSGYPAANSPVDVNEDKENETQ